MKLEEERLEALKFLTNRYIDNVWKHTGIHLLALGWMLSSARIQELIESNLRFQIGLTLLFVFFECIHLLVNVPIYRKINELRNKVQNTENQDVVESYSVSKERFAWNESMILSIAVVAIFLVWFFPNI